MVWLERDKFRKRAACVGAKINKVEVVLEGHFRVGPLLHKFGGNGESVLQSFLLGVEGLVEPFLEFVAHDIVLVSNHYFFL